MLLTGGASYQLYFLPGLIYLTVLFVPLAMLAARLGPRTVVIAALLLLSTILWLAQQRLVAPLAFPEACTMLGPMLGLPAYMPAGMAAALLMRRLPAAAGRCLMAGGATLAIMAHACQLDRPLFVLLYSLGFFAVALGAPATVGSSGVWRFLGDLSFGVYLVHALFVESLQLAAPVLGFDASRLGTTLAIMALTVAGSFAATALLRMNRWTRILAP